MSRRMLAAVYSRYLACLNDRDLDRLGDFVHDSVERNGEHIGLAGYRRMLEGNYRDIPDLRFDIQLLVADESTIASRLFSTARQSGGFSAWM